MTLNLPFSLTDLAIELGLPLPLDVEVDLPAATLNDCASGGDQSLPISLVAWDGYNHAATPAAPNGFQGNPGNDGSPQGDVTQDSHVWMNWDPRICAATYDVGKGPSGGPYSVVSNNQAGEDYAHNIGTAETDGYFVVRGNSNTDDPGPWTSQLHLRTAPTSPKGVGSSDDATCAGMTITVSWGNGSSPGVRDSVVKWRQRFKPDGGSFGAWSAYGSTASGAISFDYNVGVVDNDDQVEFELYYDEEGAGSSVSTVWTALCPI